MSDLIDAYDFMERHNNRKVKDDDEVEPRRRYIRRQGSNPPGPKPRIEQGKNLTAKPAFRLSEDEYHQDRLLAARMGINLSELYVEMREQYYARASFARVS